MSKDHIKYGYQVCRKNTLAENSPQSILHPYKNGFYAGVAFAYKLLKQTNNHKGRMQELESELRDWTENSRWNDPYSE